MNSLLMKTLNSHGEITFYRANFVIVSKIMRTNDDKSTATILEPIDIDTFAAWRKRFSSNQVFKY